LRCLYPASINQIPVTHKPNEKAPSPPPKGIKQLVPHLLFGKIFGMKLIPFTLKGGNKSREKWRNEAETSKRKKGIGRII
jgi:hypothetical protein